MLHDSMPIPSDLPRQVIHPHPLTHTRNLQRNNMVIRNLILSHYKKIKKKVTLDTVRLVPRFWPQVSLRLLVLDLEGL